MRKFFTLLLCLAFAFSSLPESGFADQLTWSGGGASTDWSDVDNWDGISAPQDMDSLIFTTGTTPNNNNLGAITPLLFTGITFDGAAGAFDLTGNDIDFSGSIINESANSQTVSLNMQLTLGGLTVDSNLGHTVTLAGNIDNGGLSTTVQGQGNATISGILSNSGGIIEQGTGSTLTLSGLNTYTGTTQVDSGTVRAGIAQVGAAGAFGNNSAVILNNTDNGGINLNNFSNTIGSLNGVSTSRVILGNAALTMGALDTNDTYSGIISGVGGSLVKKGAGTMTLSGVNTYTGGTTIDAGAITATSASALGSGNVTNNATLNIGTINLDLGDGIYRQNSGSTLNITANSTTDFGKIISTQAATGTAGANTLNVTVGGYIPNGATLTVVDTNGAGATFTLPTINVSGQSYVAFSGAFSGGNYVLTANRSQSGFTSVTTNPNSAAVGKVLDNITNPSSGMNTALTNLSSVSSTQAGNAMNTMTPTTDGFATGGSMAVMDAFTKVSYGAQVKRTGVVDPRSPTTATTDTTLTNSELDAAPTTSAPKMESTAQLKKMDASLDMKSFTPKPSAELSTKSLAGLTPSSDSQQQTTGTESKTADSGKPTGPPSASSLSYNKTSKTKFGSVVGSGVKYDMKVDKNKIQYNFSPKTKAVQPDSRSANVKVKAHKLKLGVGYQFGDEDVAPLEDLKGLNIWANGTGDYAHQDPRGFSNGYNATTWASMVGADMPVFSDSFYVGLGTGFGQSFVRSKDSSGALNIDNIPAMVYMGYTDNELPFYLLGNFIFSYGSYNGSRFVTDGVNSYTAKADYNGQQYSGFFEGGYSFYFGQFGLTPTVSFQYMHVHMEKYTETDADALSLSVKAQDYDVAQTGFGGKLDYVFNNECCSIKPDVHFKWLYDWIGDKQASTSNFVGGGSSFATEGYKPAQSSYNVGTGLSFDTKYNVSFGLGYDLTLKEDYYEHTGNVNVSYKF